MTDEFGLVFRVVAQAAEAWRGLSETMTTTAGSLTDQSTAALAPSVQGAAASFLSAWAGYATESAVIATGFASTLELVAADAAMTDEAVEQQLGGLDTRLGPTR